MSPRELTIGLPVGSHSAGRPSRQSQVWYTIAQRTLLAQTRRSVASGGAQMLGDRLVTVGRHINNLARLQRLRPVKGVRMRCDSVDGVPVETISPPQTAPAGDAAIFYLHGGGFFCGSLDTHRHVAATLARRTGLPVVHVEYRQHPKATIDQTLEDCLRAYRWLLEQGFAAERTVLAGDSAGGFLAFATVLAAQEEGLGTPAGVVGLSPLLDLDSTQREAHANASRDPMGVGVGLSAVIDCVGFDAGDRHAISPMNGDLSHFPPTLIVAAESEALLSDAERIHDALRERGRECTLKVWPGQLHGFPAMLPFLPESRAALDIIVDFIHDRLPEVG